MKITPGTTSTRIDINANLSATELENLIRQLAMARSAMQPAVPQDRADTGGQNLSGMLEAATGMGADTPDSNGQFILRLRNSGLGWLSWRLSANHIRGLQDFLNGHYPQGSTAPTSRAEKPTH